MIVSVFLSFLYLIFPFLCYIFYLIYSKVSLNKEKNLFFDLSLVSSFYLCSRFSDENVVVFLIINIPFILSMYKRRVITSAGLGIFISYFLSYFYPSYTLLIYIQYFLIFLMGFLKKEKIIDFFVIISSLSSVIMLSFLDKEFILYLYLAFMWLVVYVCLRLLIKVFINIENIINMFYSLKELCKEKKLYESLFKITHEIKNPLAVCKGYLEMFNVKDEKKSNKYINIINQEIDRTLLLLKDFSDISKMKIQKNVMDITMLVYDVCDEIMLVFNNGIKFESSLFDNEVLIDGDYNRLKQVLINIIKNAKESISKKGKVSLETKKIRNKFIIYVSDNGVGMDEYTIKNIGTAFYTTKTNGTGLGVCLSKEIIGKHFGKIEYFSKKGQGTTVKISLPILNIKK